MLNKAMLIGYVSRNPETQHTRAGKPFVTFEVSTEERWLNGDKVQKRVDWHDIVAFGKAAKFCDSFVRKGCKVYVEGKMQTRSWEIESGIKMSKTEVVAHEVKLLDSSKGSIEEYEDKIEKTDLHVDTSFSNFFSNDTRS